jgi:type I restriction enzyme S subunit
VPIREFASLVARAEITDPNKFYRQIGVRLWGNGAYEREPVKGSATKYASLFRMAAHDIVVNKIWARNGSVAVVPPELDGTYGSAEFPTFAPDTSTLEPRWFHWVTRWKSFWAQCQDKSRGATGKNRIKPERFLEITIPLPPLPDQHRIATKIDAVAARIEEAKRLAEQIEEEQRALLLRRVEELSKDAPCAPMAEVAPVVRRPVDIQPSEWYPELGIRSFGKGTFHKEAILGSKLGSKRLYRIEPGDLLFSNVFSWEGAIAVVQPEDKGRFGSHRFITCVPNTDRATTEFLCYYFLTEAGLSDIRAASPGAAGRNKTLGINKLEAIEVPLPPLPEQQKFGELLRRLRVANTIHREAAESLEHLIPAVLHQAFRGEL